jgi:putative FmdB family regulatory protein
MPIYEYRRPDGSTFEVMQSFSDDALTTDPETGVAVERVLHAPAVHFKGPGFHNTDYGTRNRQRENAAESAGASNGKSEGESGKGSSAGSGEGSGGSASSGSDASGKSSKDTAKASSTD